MPMDYFIRQVREGGRTFVVETGFDAEIAKQRRRTFQILRCS
jgi:hypothetical protein